MTATTVQIQIQTFLTAPKVDGLYTVTRAPVITSPASARLPNGVTAGASAYIWLNVNQETVISTGLPPSTQPNGWRQVEYVTMLIFDYMVLKPATSDDSWIDGLNSMVEAVKTRLRSDPTLGTTGEGALTIFTAANQFPIDTPSITVVLDPPVTVEGSQSLLVHGSVDFTVYENIPPGG